MISLICCQLGVWAGVYVDPLPTPERPHRVLGQKIKAPGAHPAAVSAGVFWTSGREQMLATGAQDGSLRLWDAKTGSQLSQVLAQLSSLQSQ